MARIRDRLAHAFNAFFNEKDEFSRALSFGYGQSFSSRPDKQFYNFGGEKTLVASIYNQIAIDASSIDMRHVKLDDNGRFKETVEDGLNTCLTLEANIDQNARQFKQDIVMTFLQDGVAAIVPVDTSVNPEKGAFEIVTLRVGKIVGWYPRHVKVNLYDDRTGQHKELILSKQNVAIVENPFHSVMNQPNSTLSRLISKLSMLDAVDKASSSGKLDLIIQLPYVVKSDARRAQAEQRAKEIEVQLRSSQYGIAYTDGTEKITQLNRPVENSLMTQIEYLTQTLYSQLGLTKEVFDGTASEAVMLNYFNRTLEPVLAAITLELKRKFLTKTARTQKHSIEFYRDPFKLVPVSSIADIADKFGRNEILSSNEIRGILGFKPVTDDPKADKLVNSNMPQAAPPLDPSVPI